ncbi:MAG: uracil-DNA glycosylase, partial [Clostridia bacterium]|nr:uracil-DNA glycosylase [Clostridia bacterium]
LTKMLLSIGMNREDVYICNIVKCRPPHNRIPEPDEAAACLPYLRMQFALVRPRVIMLLGATAGRYTLGDNFRVTRDRGRFVLKSGIWFMPTYHPSALLRDETGVKKREAWQDLQAVRDKLAELDTVE